MRRLLRWHEVSNLSLGRSGLLKFTADQVRQLSEQLVGQIALPQDANYQIGRGSFMNAFQHFPQIIVYCHGFADVIECIKFAKEIGLKPSIRAGGHSTAGYSVNDDMVIDVSAINYVRVNPSGRTAYIGAGANFAQVNAALELCGFHIPGGGCETVCVGGYMQGGGYGFTSLLFGLNCDQVAGFQMALADGSIVTANEDENADLFWAVRGGTGNNFGVLLEVEYRLQDLKPVWGFGFKWPVTTDQQAAEATRAFQVWQENFTGENVPPKLGHQALLVHTKAPLAEGPDPALAPYFVIRGMYDGTPEQCEQALAPLLKLMSDVNNYRDIWRSGSYRELNAYMFTYPTELPPNVPSSARSVAKSHYVGRPLTLAECGTIVDLYRRTRTSDNFIGFEPYGGAIGNIAPEATAFWHRHATMDVFLFSFWMHEEAQTAAFAYVADFDTVVAPLANGHCYQNYPNRDIVNFGRMYFGGNLERLVEIKHKYDPADLFNFPQGLIAAAVSAGINPPPTKADVQRTDLD